MKNPNPENPNMMCCRKCHKWFDASTAKSIQQDYKIDDEELGYITIRQFTLIRCPHCGNSRCK